MRCLSCNKILTPYEATQRAQESGEFVDLCSNCLPDIANEILPIGRPDLRDGSDDFVFDLDWEKETRYGEEG